MAGKFKLLILWFLLILLLFHSLTYFNLRYLHPILPLIIIVAASTFLSFLEKFNPRKTLQFCAIFTVLFIILPAFTSPFWGSNIKWALVQPRRPTLDSMIGKIAQENTPPQAIIVANTLRDIANIAWYGNRRSILLPLNLTDLQKIDEDFVPVNFLLLVKIEGWPPLEPEWEELIENPRDFGNFSFVKIFEIKPEENYHQMRAKIILYRHF